MQDLRWRAYSGLNHLSFGRSYPVGRAGRVPVEEGSMDRSKDGARSKRVWKYSRYEYEYKIKTQLKSGWNWLKLKYRKAFSHDFPK